MKLFNEREVNIEAYTLGLFDCVNKSTKGNPFKKETDEWYSWNKGWNAA